ncbi:MAG TPA: hypothetical protein VD772_11165, partial [Anseongella sp.]|nr:hypothetical protein [Anseongella sp.]
MSWAGLFQTIILLGALQGFIVSGLLYFSKGRSNRLLAALIFLMALASSCLYGSFKNWWDSARLQFLSNFIPMIVIMPMGPLIFFYVKSALDPAFGMGKKQYRHFYPVIIDFVPQLTAIVFILGVLAALFPAD